jgi:hypothetical protein
LALPTLRSTSAAAVVLGLLAMASSAGAAATQDRENHCMTTSLFGFREIVVAPVVGDAVGVVLGTSFTPYGVGVTVLVRPQACSAVGGSSVAFGEGGREPDAPTMGGSMSLPIVP